MKEHSIVLRITVAALVILPASRAEILANDPSAVQRYTIIDLGALVGPPGQPYGIANTGLVAGAARSDASSPLHAVLWYRGAAFDIGEHGLGGPNNAAFGLNDRGEAVGAAQTQHPDSKSEDFCGFNAFGLPASNTTCLPFIWRYGTMHPLPTLGGPNGMANRNNNKGQVVGLAETSKVEQNCKVHQFKPVVWMNGKPQALLTPVGDTDGVAAWINDKGQIVGASGTCAPFDSNSELYLTENHALLWENGGPPIDLGSLGGSGGIAGNHACAINNRTQVVGHSELANNTTFHAFEWTRETHMQDLGTYPGDYASLGLGINDEGTVVGASLDASFNPRAVIWEDGTLFDLNTRVAGTSNLYLLLADSVNNSGEIVGFAANGDGELRGFLAIPTDGAENGDSGDEAPSSSLTPDAHKLLRSFLAQRHHIGGVR